MKNCITCGESKPLEEYPPRKSARDGRRGQCRVCYNLYMSGWWHSGGRDKATAKRFGISLERYQELWDESNGLCAICGEPPSFRTLALDHDHVTGEVRALLCGQCNTAIGLMQDDPERLRSAANYIEQHRKG